MAEQLHKWYLEITKELNPKDYNENAQKSYEKLTPEQRLIDKYMAQKILSKYIRKEEVKQYLESMLKHETMARDEKSGIEIGFVLSDGIRNLIKKLLEDSHEQ